MELLERARRGDLDEVKRLIQQRAGIDTTNFSHQTALYSACENGHTEVVKYLLDNGASVNRGANPLIAAVRYNHYDCVKLLLQNHANANCTNSKGESPISIALKKCRYSIILLLVQYGAIPSDLLDKIAFQLLKCISSNKSDDMLLENNAKLKPPEEPLLHIACSFPAQWKTGRETRSAKQILSAVRLLLQQGTDVNAVSDKGDTALYRACVSQQLKIVQVLMEAGADVNLTSKKLYPLIAACEAGNVELISLLLVKAEADVKFTNSKSETCLHAIINAYTSVAVSQKPVDSVSILNIIKLFLESGVDINACCSQGETALYRASKAGHEQIVRLLLEAGADTSDTTSRRSLFAACEHGHTEIVGLLLHYGADPNALSFYSALPICCAVDKGHTDIINLLLEHGADVNKEYGSVGQSALIACLEKMISRKSETPQASNSVEERYLKILRSMLVAGGDTNMISRFNGKNAFHMASSFGMCDVMMELIQHGVDCNQLTSSGKSALDLACEKGHEGAVELLLKNSADPSTHSVCINNEVNGSRPSTMPTLCTAAKSGNETVVKMLLKHGANVNDSDKSGNTALHLAASNAVIQALLNAGANVNATNDNGETALSVVCEKRQLADANMVETFLKFNADPNIAFPLHAASRNNDISTVRLLLAYGADANLVKEYTSERTGILVGGICVFSFPSSQKVIYPSPLCIACKNGNTAIVDCLLTNGAAVAFADFHGSTPLHYAVEGLGKQVDLNSEECDPVVTLLLNHDAPVNVVSSEGETPLYMACKKGLAGVVKQLLDCKADVDLTTNESEKFPLMIACEKKFRDVALMLLDRGADVNVIEDTDTPLNVALTNGDAELAMRMLECGANVNLMEGFGDTALHVAVVQHRHISNEACVNIVRKLFESGAEPNALNSNKETVLYLACNPTAAEVNIGIVQILLENGADPNIHACPDCDQSSSSRRILGDSSILPPLSLAAICGNSELALLLINFGAIVNHSDYRGRTALHFAAGCGYDDLYYIRHMKSRIFSRSSTSTAEKLLSAGADANAIERDGASPLYLACETGNATFVKLLLSHGANPNIETTDKYPMHAACKGQYYDAVKLLLEYNADVNVHDRTGKTALHYALQSKSRYCYDRRTACDKITDLAHLLLDGGASVNSTSENGETPFYIACSHGLTSVVNKMFQCGAKVDANCGKKLPLTAACSNGHLSVVQLLLINGANPNAQEEGIQDRYRCSLPLHIAAGEKSSELLELLLKYDADINVADTGGNTPLHRVVEYSVKFGPQSILDILLENKADVNLVNGSGETPMYRAASRGLLDVVSKMLQVYGGNPNIGTRDKSPLVAACHSQNLELVDMLLKHGANPDLTGMSCDSDSKSALPLLVAVDKGNSDILMSLLNAGANASALNDEGKSIVCLAAETLTKRRYCQSRTKRRNTLTTIRLVLEHGANFNMLMRDGRSPLYLAIRALQESKCPRDWHKTCVVELLQLMVQYGAMLLDSSLGDIWCHSLNSGMLMALATFNGGQEFIVDLFRAGAGFQLTAFCCNAVAASAREAKSICLCQAAVLAGYVPSAVELQDLQLAAASDNTAGHLIQQLVNWLNEDRQQVPSLFRQCRIAIRQQLSVAVQYRTILPAIERLPLPTDLKLYLQFDGTMTEVNLSINKELKTPETTEEDSTENRHELLSTCNCEYSDSESDEDDYGYDLYDVDDYGNYGNSNSSDSDDSDAYGLHNWY